MVAWTYQDLVEARLWFRLIIKKERRVIELELWSRLMTEEDERRVAEMEQMELLLSDAAVEKDQLLASMQSDKFALSCAITRNEELKIELADAHKGFLKMVRTILYAKT